ncbi:uncharacterized protein LOC111122698 [Crassostrea virginica]
MSSLVVIAVFFGVFGVGVSAYKPHLGPDARYTELVSRLQHYLSQRQNDQSPPPPTTGGGGDGPGGVWDPSPLTSSRSPPSTGSPYPDPSRYPPSMTPFPGTTPEPDPGRSENSSFDLDSRLHCPILEELLMKRALQFPRIDDMTSHVTFHPDKYRPLLEDTKKLLTSVNDPEVAALFLVRRFTQDVVNTRLTCDTAKYQQVIIYAMIQEMKHLFQNHSLTEDLVVILQEFPFPRKLAYRILHALNGNLFHDIIDSALKMEFMELDRFVESFYYHVEHRFTEMKQQGIDPATWTDNFRPEMTNFMTQQPALQCTRLDEMKWNHGRIVNETKKGFMDMVETGYIRRMGFQMLTHVASEFYQQQWSATYRKLFPFDRVMDALIAYTKKVMQLMKHYEYRLFNSPLNSVETIFAKYLAPDQQQMFSRIVQHLSGPPLPTGYPNPAVDWQFIKKEIQDSQHSLKMLLYLIESSSGSPDMKKMVVEVVGRLDKLLLSLPPGSSTSK